MKITMKLFETVSDFVVTINNSFEIIYMNPAATQWVNFISLKSTMNLDSLGISDIEFFLTRAKSGTYRQEKNNKIINWSALPFEGGTLLIGRSYYSYNEDFIETLIELIDNIPCNIYWMDVDCRMVGANKRVLNMVNMDITEYKGLDYETLAKKANWPQDLVKKYEEDDKTVIRTGEPLIGIIDPPIPNVDGKNLYQITNRIPLKDKHSNVKGVAGISVDITKLTETQVALEKALEQANVAQKTKQTVVHNLRHDWITPFCGIHSINEMLSKDEKDPDRKELLNMAAESATVLMSHTKSILKMIEAADGLPPIKSQLINPWQICRDIHKIFLPEALRHQINFELLLEGSETEVLGDYFRLERVLINLLSNAIKFTHKKSENPTIILALRVAQVTNEFFQLNFLVKDTGIGMSGSQMNEMYEPLFRAHPAYEAVYKGAGTGLTIVRQYVSDMGGEIACESKLNKGSSFAIAIKFKRSMLSSKIFDINN